MRMRPFPAVVSAGVVLAVVGCGGSSTSSSPTSATSPSESTTSVSSPAGGASTSPTHMAKVVISPTTGKVGSVIHVEGSGYSPNVTLSGTICAVDAQGQVANPFTDCDILDVVTVTTDANGNFSTDYKIVKLPPPKAAYTIGFGVQGDPSNSAGAVITIQQ